MLNNIESETLRSKIKSRNPSSIDQTIRFVLEELHSLQKAAKITANWSPSNSESKKLVSLQPYLWPKKDIDRKTNQLAEKDRSNNPNFVKNLMKNLPNKQVNIKHELSPEDSKRRQENSTCFNCSETGHTVEYCKRERDTTRIKANSEKFKSEKA